VEDLRLKVGLFFFGIKSLVGVVPWWVDKNWCFVDSIFLGYICLFCRFQWTGNKVGIKL